MQGEVVYLFAFDVANEIATSRIQSVLGEKPLPPTVRQDHTSPRDVPLYVPLTVSPQLNATVAGQPLRATVGIYDVGAITVTLRVEVEVPTLDALNPYHRIRAADGRTLDEIAKRVCADALGNLQELLIRPAPPTDPEAYTVFCLTEIGGAEDVNRWIADQRRQIAGLLTETRADRLSDAQVDEVLRLQRSFEKTDAVVIDWDAALVVDLAGYVDDTLYVLELANLQLEELRAMDRAFDIYLNQVYGEIERRVFSIFGTSSPVLRVLRQYRVDVTKLADQVTHITKFVGDWHLARVYIAARERFYLDQWRASVERRLSQLDQLYGVLQSDIYGQRMFWMELLIVIFFAIDLWAIFFLKN